MYSVNNNYTFKNIEKSKFEDLMNSIDLEKKFQLN